MKDKLEFPVDEYKVAVKWQKGSDFMDGSPRYTFECRDPATTYERFQVVIYAERERPYPGAPSYRVYYGYVRDNKLECSDAVGPFRRLSEAKAQTLALFNTFVGGIAS